MYYAHSADGRDCDVWQPLADHLLAVAQLAGVRGAKFGIERAAMLAGLLHDLGKYTEGFQARLRGGKRVDHATAGAWTARELAGKADGLMGWVAAYAIAGHHAGLGDREEISQRLADAPAGLDEVWRREIAPDASRLMPVGFKADPDRTRLDFQIAFLGRMLFSALVDADFRDTESFYASFKDVSPDREWPRLGDHVDDLIARVDADLAAKAVTGGKMNALRAEVLDHVCARAGLPPGLFTLTVPTGGGKTLASLAFALRHARAHGLDRVIYAIPFTSIIDQTAGIFKGVLGDGFVLEHHSAIDEDRLAGREARDKLRLAMEDWAAPVVVTTNVQFFESLFANRPSACRKLHNIARSVIILDEAQAIPLPVLRPCIAALDELARNYGCSIVLCTATQPALARPAFADGLELPPDRELAPEPRRLQQVLRRVTLRRAGLMGDDALVEALAGANQGLVIVNSRGHARALYQSAVAAGLDGVIHLTTRQYAAHRRRILDDIRHRLKADLACRVIATSVVEAGVDVDFPQVWRAEAGLDQIIQAAGRCNREGRLPAGDCIVTVFATDQPAPREIRDFCAAMDRVREPDLLSLAAIETYFREVYWQRGPGQLDVHQVFDAFRVSGGTPHFDYRRIAEAFHLIEDGLAPIIIARDAPARAALERLNAPDVRPGGVARDLQSHVVQVPPKARARLCAAGHVRFEHHDRFGYQFAVLQAPNLYREDIGLCWEDDGHLDVDSLIL